MQFATKQSTAVLNTDCCIPLIGLGSFKADEKTTHEALASALKAGCRSVGGIIPNFKGVVPADAQIPRFDVLEAGMASLSTKKVEISTV